MTDAAARKLAVILHADVVGSTALVQLDETLAHARMQAAFTRFAEVLAGFGGMVREIRGDALVAEFQKVSDAVSAALAFQAESGDGTAEHPALRVGIALGEVVVADGTVTGAGVVLAQRLEQLAKPGGVCLQGAAYETMPRRLPFDYRDLGRRRLKGFDEPVRAYAVTCQQGQAVPVPAAGSGAVPRTAVSHKPPAVAVLPFANMGSDPEQEAFCDSLTEDIITALSRSRGFAVTSRSSTFAWKGTSPDVREVGERLGASHVIEGSVRRAGERLRITVQLLDAASGNHVWADRYECEGDEFTVQDEIAQRIASVVGERVWQDVARSTERLRPEEYGPYQHVFLGIGLLHRLEPLAVEQAKVYFERSLALAPDLVLGHLGLGFCHLVAFAFWGDPSGAGLTQAEQHARKLEQIAPDDAQTFRLLSRVHNGRRRYEEAQCCVERALRLNPNDGDIIANKGVFLLFHGEARESLVWFDRVLAMHADTPHTVDIMLMWKAVAWFALAEYETAITTLQGASGLAHIKNVLNGAFFARAGNAAAARRAAAAVLAQRPQLSASDIGIGEFFRDEALRRGMRAALRQAGLP